MNAPGFVNAVLVGFMGSGKSSAGRTIAHFLGGRFVDTDRLVIDHTGREITEIFAENGEAFFRQEETAALKSLLGQTDLVVATGGGIVTVPENLPLLKELGTVIWLDAREDIIWDRVSRNKKRPLLNTENPRETMRRLLETRVPLYEAAADFRIDTSDLTHDQVAESVREWLKTRSR